MPRRRLLTVAAFRIMLAAVSTLLLLCIACAGLFFTTQPPLLSLLFEPLSLLLMPGLVVSLLTAGAHDLSPELVVQVSAAFYFVLFSILLIRRPLAHRRSR